VLFIVKVLIRDVCNEKLTKGLTSFPLLLWNKIYKQMTCLLWKDGDSETTSELSIAYFGGSW